MMAYIAEFIGTMLLILLGDGVVANVTLNKSGMKGAGSIQITFAWGLAVMIPAFIFGAASGAHFNPALTLALAVDGSLSWGLVPGYIIAQFAGAFVGACLVYALFKDHLGPRLAHAVLPIKGKGDSNWGYAPVVILGPVMGAVAAVLLYGVIPWA